MPNAFQNQTALAARILISLLFIMSGFGKIGGFAGTAGYIASAGLPLPQVVAALTILIELGGGLLILIGFQTRLVAYVLAAFTLLAALIFHPYWSAPDAARMGQYLNFWKNISISGGFLALAAFGAGSISLDAKRGR